MQLEFYDRIQAAELAERMLTDMQGRFKNRVTQVKQELADRDYIDLADVTDRVNETRSNIQKMMGELRDKYPELSGQITEMESRINGELIDSHEAVLKKADKGMMKIDQPETNLLFDSLGQADLYQDFIQKSILDLEPASGESRTGSRDLDVLETHNTMKSGDLAIQRAVAEDRIGYIREIVIAAENDKQEKLLNPNKTKKQQEQIASLSKTIEGQRGKLSATIDRESRCKTGFTQNFEKLSRTEKNEVADRIERLSDKKERSESSKGNDELIPKSKHNIRDRQLRNLSVKDIQNIEANLKTLQETALSSKNGEAFLSLSGGHEFCVKAYTVKDGNQLKTTFSYYIDEFKQKSLKEMMQMAHYTTTAARIITTPLRNAEKAGMIAEQASR